jgi:16S rRNA (cytosine967-C5)-methyltransferase
VASLMDQYGMEETEQICHISNQPGPITLRRNSLKCKSNKALMDRIQQEDNAHVTPLLSVYKYLPPANSSSNNNTSELLLKSWQPPNGCLRLETNPHENKRSIWSMQSWKEGWFEVQDVGSQLIVDATEACAGETVVDYCAGNGGKTLALASRLHATSGDETATNVVTNTSTSRIYAHDIVDERIRQLRGSLGRAGLLNGKNAIEIHTTTNETTDLEDGMADIVLVDAPCSSSGALRRSPSHRWIMTQQDMQSVLPKLQLEVLRLASRLVKPGGGRLVYATCSITKWENENVVKAWEEENSSSNATDGDGGSWVPWDFDPAEWPPQPGMAPHCRSLVPHKHDSDGFFIARWKRK